MLIKSVNKEVLSYFEGNDLELARKRLLDLIYDKDIDLLLIKAINWSKVKPVLDSDVDAVQAWKNEGLTLLNAIENDNVESVQGANLLQVNKLSKQYKAGKFALNAIDFELHKGEIVGVVGENGNGKTTFLRHIAGELAQDDGLIDYNFFERKENHFYDLKNATGFIPQRIPRWWGKLRHNLEFTAAIHGIEGAKNTLLVDFVLERFGLTQFQNLLWTQISSGYRTRFEIARIILLRPALLVLDEPLANLDINAQQTLLQDLKYLAKSKRHPMGVILTSQQLFEVEKVADRVLFIQAGKGRYNSELAHNDSQVFLEIETLATREQIESALGNRCTNLKFNGGIYQLEFEGNNAQCLQLLIDSNIELTYFRNITSSTKRFFV